MSWENASVIEAEVLGVQGRFQFARVADGWANIGTATVLPAAMLADVEVWIW